MNNYYPLPEWYPQDATILVWPHRYTDWSNSLDEISNTYLDITKVICKYQPVLIICFDHDHNASISKLCSDYGCDMPQIIFIEIETNDTWVRDYGPQLLLGNQDYQYLDLEFNAWSEQYPYHLDNLFAESFFDIVDQDHCEYYRAPIVIEGGNLEFDSNATLLTNITCLKRNNPKLAITTDELEEKLKQELSVKRILGVEVPPLCGDDTGGHIDTLARFINNKTIVYAATSNGADPNYSSLSLLKIQLETMTTGKGEPYELIPVLMPKDIALGDQEEYAPASYINFVFINGALLVPLYGDEHDNSALELFAKACPDRKIIGIHANELLKQFGSLHCATLHIPEKVLHESRFNSAK